ncbi:hypothetical protein ABW19_dt0206542 [Dactylella cylindrospora]|nr:hypothetical protein ABW19_dt0206542 [Dactylella cylindrospora]
MLFLEGRDLANGPSFFSPLDFLLFLSLPSFLLSFPSPPLLLSSPTSSSHPSPPSSSFSLTRRDSSLLLHLHVTIRQKQSTSFLARVKGSTSGPRVCRSTILPFSFEQFFEEKVTC